MTIEAGGAKSEELQKKDILNPEGQWGDTKTYSEEEYKNLQSFSTKAQQEKIALAERLVKNSPKELETMDVKLQNKVIESLYWASSLEELKIISPELFENEGWGGDDNDDDKLKLERKVQLMEYKMNQGAVSTVIENLKISNKDLADTVPEFEAKMKEEMKAFSSDLSIKEKAEKAFRLISWWNTSSEAYLAMQGKTTIKGSDKKDVSGELSNSPLANAFSRSLKRR